MSWIETARGTVYRWEVDHVDHFTVAYYFTRFQDATQALLQAIGLDDRGAEPHCRIDRCHVRYLRELRVGDLLHVRSGVSRVDRDGLGLVHELYDSGDGALCTTVELQAHVLGPAGAPRALSGAQRAAVEACWVSWEPPPGPAAAPSAAHESEAGFLETCRDTLKPWEVDPHGAAAWPAYIHRFSAANGHAIAAFGMTPAYMRQERRGFSTFEFRLTWPGALQAGALVEVQSRLLHVGGSSLRLLHRMRDAGTGAVVATLEQAGVHLDLEARRPAPLPEPLRSRALELLAR
jgi:acyl-CoA thioesterase FadM